MLLFYIMYNVRGRGSCLGGEWVVMMVGLQLTYLVYYSFQAIGKPKVIDTYIHAPIIILISQILYKGFRLIRLILDPTIFWTILTLQFIKSASV